MTTAHLLAVVLFSAALGAALQGFYLWFAWRPAAARCALCGTSTTGEGVNTARSFPVKHGHDGRGKSPEPIAAPSPSHSP